MDWAIVVGGGLNALGVVRSLGAHRVPVALMFKGTASTAARSRYVTRRVPGVDYAELPDRLASLAAQLGGRPVLFLTEEEAVRVVSAARDRLAGAIRFRFAMHETMLALTHKEGVQQLAEQHGLPIPRAVRLRQQSDLCLLEQLRYPCVLKPALKHAGYGARFKKAYVVRDAVEAQGLDEKISPVMPDLVVEDWMEGADASIHFRLQHNGADSVTSLLELPTPARLSADEAQRVATRPPELAFAMNASSTSTGPIPCCTCGN